VAAAAAAALAWSYPYAALVGLATLAVSWAYSMPPIRLLGRGWGELATSLVVAMAVPFIGVAAQGAAPSSLLWWSTAALVPVHAAMMLAFEIPDLQSDAAAGKRVLAVRIGLSATQTSIVALYGLAAAAVGVGWLAAGLQSEHVLGAVAAIPGAVLVTRLMHGDRYQWLTAAAVGTFVLTALGLLVGTFAAT
jgi:1,4-dihydroxy-2-naphthoate octaprenyltransferase